MSSAVLTSAPASRAQIPPAAPLPYRMALGASLLLVLATSLLYLPIIHDPFTNIDDQGYVYENFHVQEGLTWNMFKWAATTFDDNNWHPLTWISHAVDCQLFGTIPPAIMPWPLPITASTSSCCFGCFCSPPDG